MDQDQNHDHEYQDQPARGPEAVPVINTPPKFQPDPAPRQWSAAEPVVAAQPVQFTPAPAVTSVAELAENNPKLIILQWLTYAFWGFTVLSMSFLVVTVLAFFVNKADFADAPLYGIAAVLVLLPLSVICDIFYTKHEPAEKTGVAAVVMSIHAVIFALFAIGSLITIVFSIVSLIVSSSDTQGTMVTLYSALIIALLYVVVFLRTILPGRLLKLRLPFVILMAVIVGVICVAGFIGPVADAQLTRTDKLIEANLPAVGDGVSAYASKNNRLPDSLGNLTLTGDANKLIADNLVTYKKDSGPSSGAQAGSFYYQLCVTYKKALENPYATSSYRYDNNGYSSMITSYYHAAGDVCYKLEATYYDYSYMNSGAQSLKSN
ncbi:MAG: hypothetical protein ABI716_02275 [Candidatus Saccharibacteria bacterium]